MFNAFIENYGIHLGVLLALVSTGAAGLYGWVVHKHKISKEKAEQRYKERDLWRSVVSYPTSCPLTPENIQIIDQSTFFVERGSMGAIDVTIITPSGGEFSVYPLTPAASGPDRYKEDPDIRINWVIEKVMEWKRLRAEDMEGALLLTKSVHTAMAEYNGSIN